MASGLCGVRELGWAVGLLLMFICGATGAEESGKTSQPTPDKNKTSAYFGTTRTLDSLDSVNALWPKSETDGPCFDITEPCVKGVELLESLFDDLYRERLPDFLVRLEKRENQLEARRPVMLFEEKSTPYILGVEHVWVLVLSDCKLPLDAWITTIHRKPPNPFAGVLGLLKLSGDSTSQSSKPHSVTSEIEWRPVSGDSKRPLLYLGAVRLEIGLETINRINLVPSKGRIQCLPSEDAGGGAPGSRGSKFFQLHQPPGQFRPDEDPPPADPSPSLGFHGVHAHFSNSKSSFAAFSVAIAGTFDVEDTRLGRNGGETAFNGYALAKFFLPGRRPRLHARPDKNKLYRWSLGAVVGTNVADDPFDEVVLGLSLGHLVGKAGLLAAANSIAPSEGESGDRQWRLLLGVDYTF